MKHLSSNNKIDVDVKETCADLAYLAYQLRKVVERAARTLEQQHEALRREQQLQRRWFTIMVVLMILVVCVDVILWFL